MVLHRDHSGFHYRITGVTLRCIGIYIYIYIHTHTYIYIYMCVYIGYSRVCGVKLKDLGFSLYRNCIRFMSGVLSCVLAVVVKALYNFCVY